MAGLTTHVLDTMHGKPAAGVAVRLSKGHAVLVETQTNADGRVDQPLLTGEALAPGAYRLAFEVGAYSATWASPCRSPRSWKPVVIDFGVADVGAHYHVPLLVSPFAYSTYRGS